MGNEFGLIRIANLEGTAKAFANAADLDQDGKVEASELAVFNRLIAEAGLNQDEGLVVEREQLDERGTKEATPKELAKQEDKMYKECFGFKAGSADLANFKSQVAAYDSRVIAVFKQLKAAGDMEAVMKLNDQIANRPDMTNYIGNSAGYLAQLDKYADAAELLLQQSDREFIAGEVRGGTEAVINNDNRNTALLAGITIAVGEELKANMDENTAAILKGIQDGTAEVVEQVKDSEGNIKQTVRSAEGHICQVVKNTKGEIIKAVRQEGADTRMAVHDEGDRTRQEVNTTAEQTQILNGRVSKINTNVSRRTQKVKDAINNLQNKILNANVSFEVKDRALALLGSFCSQSHIALYELQQMQARIQGILNGTGD